MSLDSRALESGSVYRFQLRLALGTVVPVAPVYKMSELMTGLRRAGELLAVRTEAVATLLGDLGERGWRAAAIPPTGREVLAGHGFAGLDGAVLPEAVSVVKEATTAEIMRDLSGAGGDWQAELLDSLVVRVEDLDIPARVGRHAIELRYSPQEYLETFSVRG